MSEISESRMRNQALRKNIRRMELDNYFQERRKELLSQYQDPTFSIMFNSGQEQEQFLEECARELTGEPKAEWLPTVMRLRKAIFSFKGEFEQWFSKSIIRNLREALNVAYHGSALTEQVEILLNDMLYSCITEGQSGFSQRFMTYEPVPDIITLAICQSRPLHARINTIEFLSKIIIDEPNYRNAIVRDGAGRVLVELALELIATTPVPESPLENYLRACHAFLRGHKSVQATASFINLALSLVSPLQTIFMLEKLGERCMKLCMDNLLFLLALDKESMYRSMYNCVGLAEKLLNILHTENGILRSKAAHMLSYFSYCDCSDITEDLFNRNIIEHLWEGYQRFLPNNDFSKHILNILSNLADNEHNSEVVARHPIFSFIIGQFISADSVDVQRDALFCLGTLLRRVPYHLLQGMLKKYDLLRLLVQCLVDSPTEAKTLLESLMALHALVERSKGVFHYKDNPIISEMERMYNLSIIAENIKMTNSNKGVGAAAERLFDSIHHEQLQNLDFV